MKIAIIGAGNVGGTLGKGWAKAGHQITFGTRNPAKDEVQELVKSIGSSASAHSVGDAVAASDVVVLTTPWDGAQGALESAGDLTGKILIDVTNPLGSGPDALEKGLVVGHTTSAGEQVAGWASGAQVVKAFNTTGFPNMANPVYDSTPLTMFYCGDDAEAKQTVTKLGEDLGFEMADAGPLSNARLLEPLAMLWIDLALKQGNGVNFGFKIIKR